MKGNTPDSSFVDKGYVSTSTSLDVAKKFAGSNGVVMEIALTAGSKYINIERSFKKADKHNNFSEDEHEFLLPRNSKFLIRCHGRIYERSFSERFSYM